MISYIIFIDNNFLRIFVSSIISAILNSPFDLLENELNPMKILLHYASYIIITVVMYFWCRLSKTTFYYKEKCIFQNKFSLDILNNLKNGVILYNIDKRKTKYLNDYLKKYKEFHQEEVEHDIALEGHGNYEHQYGLLGHHATFVSIMPMINPLTEIHKTNTTKTFNKDEDNLHKINLFSKITDANKDLPTEIYNALQTKSFDEIVELFTQHYCRDDNNSFFFDEFIFLGFIELTENETNSIFEFYIRGVHGYNGTYFQFMLNDVSKTKLQEQEKLMEKTLILGKISHEFKNPLIVICETIDEIKDNTQMSDYNNELSPRNDIEKIARINKLDFLRNLCQFMILLIKDFELVASMENKLNIDIFPSEVSFHDFLTDIGEIVNTLIKKKNSRQEINFLVNLDGEIKTIYTDCLRLKQILINLLSNSVKFTEKGYIELRIEKYLKYYDSNKEFFLPNNDLTEDIKLNHKLNQYIKFSVVDTGKGISEEFRNKFNWNTNGIHKENTFENSMGTGYGLGIVQQLCKLVGSKIEVFNNDPNGSLFSFSIYQENLIDNSGVIDVEFTNENEVSYDKMIDFDNVNYNVELNDIDTQFTQNHSKQCFLDSTKLIFKDRDSHHFKKKKFNTRPSFTSPIKNLKVSTTSITDFKRSNEKYLTNFNKPRIVVDNIKNGSENNIEDNFEEDNNNDNNNNNNNENNYKKIDNGISIISDNNNIIINNNNNNIDAKNNIDINNNKDDDNNKDDINKEDNNNKNNDVGDNDESFHEEITRLERNNSLKNTYKSKLSSLSKLSENEEHIVTQKKDFSSIQINIPKSLLEEERKNLVLNINSDADRKILRYSSNSSNDINKKSKLLIIIYFNTNLFI